MLRRRKDCHICGKRNLVKLSNHLADIHQLFGKKRRYYLSKTKRLVDQSESEELFRFPKRMRNESKCKQYHVMKTLKSDMSLMTK